MDFDPAILGVSRIRNISRRVKKQAQRVSGFKVLPRVSETGN